MNDGKRKLKMKPYKAEKLDWKEVIDNIEQEIAEAPIEDVSIDTTDGREEFLEWQEQQKEKKDAEQKEKNNPVLRDGI